MSKLQWSNKTEPEVMQLKMSMTLDTSAWVNLLCLMVNLSVIMFKQPTEYVTISIVIGEKKKTKTEKEGLDL